MNPFLLTDGYKTSHHNMYPEGTTLVTSNFTPRSEKYAPVKSGFVVVFGIRLTVNIINTLFTENFFKRDKEEVLDEIKTKYNAYLGLDYDVEHIAQLHDVGCLPVKITGLPEGSLCPIGVPMLIIENTIPKFYWLTNFLETIISNLLWKPVTSATTAFHYKKLLTQWAEKTDRENVALVDYQGHDFSMRGMDSIAATISSGMGHALFFSGSDSIPVIHGISEHYKDSKVYITTVPATEHSVMCAGSKDDEIGTFRRLMETYPTGILSIVSDTWDLWKVCTEYLPTLKDEIMQRNGKIVIRPDSGDPVDIICGEYEPHHKDYEERRLLPAYKGVIELLWDVFGGTTNAQGYKVLDSHIGAIYGDSITLERAEQICKRLEAKGFASTNVVFGIGSFTYQYNTRDTYGFAMKATYVEINGEPRPIFKDPVTDDGTKKSLKGYPVVVTEDDTLKVLEYDTRGEAIRKMSETTQKTMLIYYNNDHSIQNDPSFSSVKMRAENYLRKELKKELKKEQESVGV